MFVNLYPMMIPIIIDASGATSMASSQQKAFVWSEKATLAFFASYKTRMSEFIGGKLKSLKRVYEAVADDMKKQEHDVNSVQVENKFKWCKKTYLKMERHDESTGRGRKIVPFQE